MLLSIHVFWLIFCLWIHDLCTSNTCTLWDANETVLTNHQDDCSHNDTVKIHFTGNRAAHIMTFMKLNIGKEKKVNMWELNSCGSSVTLEEQLHQVMRVGAEQNNIIRWRGEIHLYDPLSVNRCNHRARVTGCCKRPLMFYKIKFPRSFHWHLWCLLLFLNT